MRALDPRSRWRCPRPRTIRLRSLACVSVLLLCGCGDAGSSNAGSNHAANNSAASHGGSDDGGGVDIQVGDVQIQAGQPAGGKLPANFAKDVPIYAGAVAKANVLAGAGDEATGFVTMHVAAPVEKVGAFYKADLKSQGWDEKQYVVSQSNGKTSIMIGATKDARQLAIVISTDQQDQTVVNLTLGRK